MKKITTLSAYFSHSGNTQVIARQIHEKAGGDLFRIVSKDPYPAEYNAVVERARKELDRDYLPALKTTVADMDAYSRIFIGYPNWWGTVPRPVAAFLSAYDFSGKTIAPFCTHEGSGLGQSIDDIKKACPQSTVLEGIAIRGGDVRNAQGPVTAWLKDIDRIMDT